MRSEPHLFDGILRLRTHFIIQIMQEEVQRLKSCDGKKAVESLLDVSISFYHLNFSWPHLKLRH